MAMVSSVCIISLGRLIWFWVQSTHDVAWSAVAIANWTCIEVNAAILCACLPTLTPLLVRPLPALLVSARRWKSDRDTADWYGGPPNFGAKKNRVPQDPFESCDSSVTPCDDSNAEIDITARPPNVTVAVPDPTLVWPTESSDSIALYESAGVASHRVV